MGSNPRYLLKSFLLYKKIIHPFPFKDPFKKLTKRNICSIFLTNYLVSGVKIFIFWMCLVFYLSLPFWPICQVKATFYLPNHLTCLFLYSWEITKKIFHRNLLINFHFSNLWICKFVISNKLPKECDDFKNQMAFLQWPRPWTSRSRSPRLD